MPNDAPSGRKRRRRKIKTNDDECSFGIALIICICDTQNRTVWSRVESQPELFIGEEARWFDAVSEMFELDDALPDLSTLFREMGERFKVTGRTNYYLKRCRERRATNELRPVLRDLQTAVQDNELETISELFEDGHRILSDNQPAHTQTRESLGAGMRTLHSQFSSQFLDYRIGLNNSLTTGWDVIDETIAGGYLAGTLNVWTARPNLGKTYLLLYQAWRAILQNRRCLFVTVEMSREQIFERFAALAAGLDPRLVTMKRLSNVGREKLIGVVENYEHSRALDVLTNDGTVTISQIEQEAHRYEPDAIYIDGLYLLHPSDPRSFRDRFTKVAAIMDELRAFCTRSNTPVIATTQLNRYAGKGGADASLENIGYSDTIASHSDIVVAVKTLKEFASAGKLTIEAGLAEHAQDYRVLTLVKNRRGQVDVDFIMNFAFAPTNFTEAEAVRVRRTTATRSSAGSIVDSTTDDRWL